MKMNDMQAMDARLAEAVQHLIDVNSEPLMGKFRIVFSFYGQELSRPEAIPFNREGYAFSFPTADFNVLDTQLDDRVELLWTEQIFDE